MSNRTILIGSALTLSAILISTVWSADDKPPQGEAPKDVKSQQIEVKDQKEGEQIDLGSGGDGITTMDEAGRRNVSMSCFTTNGGRIIRITVNNANATPRRCQSECFYEYRDGNSRMTGVHRCVGALSGRYNGIFCDSSERSGQFRVTNPGGFDCQA